jgi:hypothetical protein
MRSTQWSNGPMAQRTEKPLVHRTIEPLDQRKQSSNGPPVHPSEFPLDHWTVEPSRRNLTLVDVVIAAPTMHKYLHGVGGSARTPGLARSGTSSSRKCSRGSGRACVAFEALRSLFAAIQCSIVAGIRPSGLHVRPGRRRKQSTAIPSRLLVVLWAPMSSKSLGVKL